MHDLAWRMSQHEDVIGSMFRSLIHLASWCASCHSSRLQPLNQSFIRKCQRIKTMPCFVASQAEVCRSNNVVHSYYADTGRVSTPAPKQSGKRQYKFWYA